MAGVSHVNDVGDLGGREKVDRLLQRKDGHVGRLIVLKGRSDSHRLEL